MKNIAIVLAAGQGKRMGSKVPKQYLLLKGKPVLFYSLKAFQESFIDAIVLVTPAEDVAYCRKEIVETYHLDKVIDIVPGGRERYHSVVQGLACISHLACDYIWIHDGARPFLNTDIIERVYQCAKENGNAVTAMPVKDTIKIVDQEQFVVQTPNRQSVWQIQTPQTFESNMIRSAYQKLMQQESELLKKGITITDDAMVVENTMNQKVKLIEGSYENIKITTPEDLKVAELFFST
ncbi:MAG: 2-C-methyl-D-erythritol 4-phosphate cytidylyltransferase [Clostridia bacterium]|nr:2-C-methyl-D-erythritol 4-phosphate cytidylyltransferase [Clostridia bacterium]